MWPQSETPICWDAVGRANVQDQDEWLLAEAKADLQELEYSSRAKEAGGRAKIHALMEATKLALGVPANRDWMTKYYQFCNRVMALHFLVENDQPAHLLLIYFVGDKGSERRVCPQEEDGWMEALSNQDRHVGLPESHKLVGRIHKLFLHVCPR